MEREKGNHSLKSDDVSSLPPLVQLDAADFEIMADELMAAESLDQSTAFDVGVDNFSFPEELVTSCGRADVSMCTKNLSSNVTHSRHPASQANTAKKPSNSTKAGRCFSLALSQANKKHVCNVCGAAFGRSCNLAWHSRIHTGEKAFKFTHTGEKRFKCDQCDAAFGQSGHLTTHARIHTGEKPFKCDQCDAAFGESGNLTTHARIHTGEKPYKCDQCDAAFCRSDSLTAHSRIHTGEKPFKCDQCDAAFSQPGNLTRHARIHTGEKPYKCDQCGAAFAQSGSLKRHSSIHTGEKAHK